MLINTEPDAPSMRPTPSRLLRVMVFSYVPVIVTILIMIILRANDLTLENNNAGLEQSFFNPTTPEQAIIAGFTIWIIGAFFVAFLAVVLYGIIGNRTKRGPLTFLTITLVLSFIIAVGAYMAKIPFAPEAAFEMMACGIGYGLLVPAFYERERNLVL